MIGRTFGCLLKLIIGALLLLAFLSWVLNAGGPPEPAHKFSDGALISNGDSVYVICQGKRCLIPNKITFEALGWSWDQVRRLSGGEIARILTGSPIPNTPWGSLIGAQGHSNVYVVWRGKHLIPDAQTARDLRGGKWRDYVCKDWTVNQLRAVPTKANIPDSSTWGKPHPFSEGYCTDYVAQRRLIPWGGNAKEWLENAKTWPNFNFFTSKDKAASPVPGAILVMHGWKESPLGHVAFVESVEGNTFTVSHMNWPEKGEVTTKRFTIGKVPHFLGFIY